MNMNELQKKIDDMSVENINEAATLPKDDGGRAALVEKMGFDPANQEEKPKRDKLNFNENDTYKLVFESCQPISTEFGDTNMLLVKGLEDDKEYIYFSKSKRLAFAILKSNLVPGDKFTLKKIGEGMERTYEVIKGI